MATLTLRRAAITYSRGPKGMKAWQLLLDWLTPAERARLTRAAVGLCREVRWVRTVARNTHTNTKKCYNKIPCNMILRLPSSPRPLKNTHHYHLGWGVGHDMNYSATNRSSSHELYDTNADDDDPSQSGQTMAFDRYSTNNTISWLKIGIYMQLIVVKHC